MLEKTLESLLNSKEIKPINPKDIFIGRREAEELRVGLAQRK